MNTTAESTVELEQRLRFLLPATDQASLFAMDAERLQLKAEVAELAPVVEEKRAQDAERGARPRAARTQALEALVHKAIQAKRSTLQRDPSRRSWTSTLMRHFARTGVRAPDEEVVRRIAKEFPGFS